MARALQTDDVSSSEGEDGDRGGGQVGNKDGHQSSLISMHYISAPVTSFLFPSPCLGLTLYPAD